MRIKQLLFPFTLSAILLLSLNANACIGGSGEQYYPLSKLAASPVDSQQYYQQNFNIKNIDIATSNNLFIDTSKASTASPKIKVRIPSNFSGKPISLLLEHHITREKNKQRIQQSVFLKTVLNFNSNKESDNTLTIRNQNIALIRYQFDQQGLLISLPINPISKRWTFTVIIHKKSDHKKTIAIARTSHAYKTTCGAPNSIYVKSKARAIWLDKQRTTGLTQYKVNWPSPE